MFFMNARNAKHCRSKSEAVRVGENAPLRVRTIDRQRAGRNSDFGRYYYHLQFTRLVSLDYRFHSWFLLVGKARERIDRWKRDAMGMTYGTA